MKTLVLFQLLGLVAVSSQVSLSDGQQAIVNFVKDELTDNTHCPRVVVDVEKIQQQVVAGTLYKMDLVLQGHQNNGPECGAANQKTTCHMRVIDIPWESNTEILWEDGTCDRPIKKDLTDCQQEVVDFVELAYQGIPGGPIIDCPREIVSVEKFTSQVVSGTLYNIDIVLRGHVTNDASCGQLNERTSCRVQVHDVPWESGKTIVWDESTCDEPGTHNDNPPIAGGHTEIKGDLNPDQQEVVDFAELNLNPFGPTLNCGRKIVNVDKFTQQVVAGTLYNLDIVTEGHETNDASCGRLNERTSCKMQIHDVPWENGKTVVWEKSTCEQLADFDGEAPIAGGETEIVGDLTQEQQEVVDFAELNLNPFGPIVNCGRKIVNVDKFVQQVVAGTLYKLDIVTEGHKTNDVSCGRLNEKTRCSIHVHDVPWESGKQVLWEDSTCEQLADATDTVSPPGPPPGSEVKVNGALKQDQLEIVDHVRQTLENSECPRKLHNVVNFSEQLVAGTVYRIEIEIEGHKNNDAACRKFNPKKRCEVKVYDVPWESKREILWDESTCDKSRGSEIEFPIAGGVSKVNELTKRHHDVADFAYDQFSRAPGATVSACGVKKVVSTENFTEQVVAGNIYTFDLILDYDEVCPGFTPQRCSMKVYVDPTGRKELQESKCDDQQQKIIQ